MLDRATLYIHVGQASVPNSHWRGDTDTYLSGARVTNLWGAVRLVSAVFSTGT